MGRKKSIFFYDYYRREIVLYYYYYCCITFLISHVDKCYFSICFLFFLFSFLVFFLAVNNLIITQVLNSSITMPQLEIDVWNKIGFDWRTVSAFQTFYNNLKPNGSIYGLQEHYIRMVAAVAQRFQNETTVIGYEIMNEPPPR